MTQQCLIIKQGDADTFTETISGLDSLSGYSATMYIFNDNGTEIDAIDGTIDGFEITYDLVNESSKIYDPGTYAFETKIFDSWDHVYTPSTGLFVVENTNEEDPS